MLRRVSLPLETTVKILVWGVVGAAFPSWSPLSPGTKDKVQALYSASLQRHYAL